MGRAAAQPAYSSVPEDQVGELAASAWIREDDDQDRRHPKTQGCWVTPQEVKPVWAFPCLPLFSAC